MSKALAPMAGPVCSPWITVHESSRPSKLNSACKFELVSGPHILEGNVAKLGAREGVREVFLMTLPESRLGPGGLGWPGFRAVVPSA